MDIIEMKPAFVASRLYLDGQTEYLSEDADGGKMWVSDISMARLFSDMKEVVKYFSSDIIRKAAMELIDGTVIFPVVMDGTLQMPIKISKLFITDTGRKVCS